MDFSESVFPYFIKIFVFRIKMNEVIMVIPLHKLKILGECKQGCQCNGRESCTLSPLSSFSVFS